MIRRPGFILALLTGLNLINLLDRLVIAAVLPKIQEELVLTNFTGGLLAMVFLLGFFATSPIFGALGDRVARKWLIALGVLVWSVATCSSGLAKTGTGLLIARVFVGIGEACYAILAPTIIVDVTPPERRGRALAIYFAAMPVGAALGFIVGGLVEHRWGWRSAFFVAGGPGVILAFLCLLIAEPERRLATDKANIWRDVRTLLRIDLYRKGVLGLVAQTAAVGASTYWAPKFLYARYGLPLGVANARFGVIVVVAGGVATFVGGTLADRARRKIMARGGPQDGERDHLRALLRICAIGSLCAAPLAACAYLAPAPSMFFGLIALSIFGISVAQSPIGGVTLGAVPTHLRASAMAFSIFAIHAFGDLWSPPLVGLIADHAPIQLAMMLLPAFIFLSGWLWWPPRADRA